MRAPDPTALLQAASTYADLTGDAVDADASDPTLPHNAALWSAFTRKTVRLPRGGHEGEWLLLELGLKPVLRQWLPEPRLAAFAARCRRRGLVFEVGASDGVGRGPKEGVLVYVARDAGAAAEARDVEAELLRGQQGADLDSASTGTEASPASADRQTRDAVAARALGTLLGFPTCCIDAFVDVARDGRDEKSGMLRRALAHTDAFHPRLNNLSLGAFHYIGWYPCRFDCPDSLRIAGQAAAELKRRDEAAFVVTERILARPRHWVSERRQLIFSGRVTGQGLRFKAVRTPWALDGDDRHVALEWIFYRSVAAPLTEGGALVPGDDAWTLFRRDRPPQPWRPPAGGLFVPFGVG
jgi:hypothetical protein